MSLISWQGQNLWWLSFESIKGWRVVVFLVLSREGDTAADDGGQAIPSHHHRRDPGCLLVSCLSIHLTHGRHWLLWLILWMLHHLQHHRIWRRRYICKYLLTTLQSMMNAKLGQQSIWPCVIKTISMIPHNLLVCGFQVKFHVHSLSLIRASSYKGN